MDKPLPEPKDPPPPLPLGYAPPSLKNPTPVLDAVSMWIAGGLLLMAFVAGAGCSAFALLLALPVVVPIAYGAAREIRRSNDRGGGPGRG